MFLYFSVIVNLVFLYFVYILHFKTFTLTKRKECDIKIEPSARRVAIFVSEGLGSDFLFNVTAEDGRERSLLRRVVEGEGAWGVSKCFSQEGSMQGIMALLSGTQYDPSIVLYYAKLVRLKLDNVFSRVDQVYIIGDPYFPEIFEGKKKKNWLVKTWTRKFKEEIDSGGNFFAYDDFAIDNLGELFTDKTRKTDNKTIYVFFLSGVNACVRQSNLFQECVNTLVNLDRQIEKTVRLFESYYNDSSTSFILTSDRNMIKRWKTGRKSGNPENIPFLAWGAGIKRFGRKGSGRMEINNEDVAPLVSVLLGNDSPNNSIGVIPWKIVNIHENQLAGALYCNELLLNDIATVYAQETGNNDYMEALPNVDLNITTLRNQLKDKITERNYSEVAEISKRLFPMHQEQIRLYKSFLKPLIWTLVINLYLGFAFWTLQRAIFNTIIKEEDDTPKLSFWHQLSKANLKQRVIHNAIYDITVAAVACTVGTFFFFKGFPFFLLLSFLLATFIWWRVLKNVKYLINTNFQRQLVESTGPWMIGSLIGTIWFVFGISFPLVRQFLFGISVLVVVFTLNPRVENILLILFVVTSAVFVFLLNFRVMDEDMDTSGLTIGTISWIISMGFYIYYNPGPLRDFGVVALDCTSTGLSLWNALNIRSMRTNEPKTIQFLISWIMLSIGPIFPVLSTQHGIKRFCHVGFGLCATFILLSEYNEVTGLLVFSTFLMILYCMEVRNADMLILAREQRVTKKREHLNKVDIKMAYFLFVLIWSGYILTSTGNYPKLLQQKWTSNFFENFDHLGPVIALLAYKMLIPVAITCSMFGLLYKQLNYSMNQMLEWFLYLNNVACFHLLINAKGEEYPLGEIFQSITNLALSHIIPIAVILLSKILEVYNGIDLQRFFRRN
ncbi:GPI ethanolamine phosphate transferase 1-like [Cimex lectularius]|uniref:GPI ethanolamine phosphate transferase 1 n=1 Tax=Cimex lectularius TaxID=79782 RepID=A0A8I6RD04_CIMLE|nr:GPI ethanolamine phosphate transferase 1-like [Cimex lectularius]